MVSIRLGSVLSSYVVPVIQSRYGKLEISFEIMTGVAVIGFLTILVVNYIDRYNKK